MKWNAEAFPLHLMLVDDHAVVREGIRRILETTGPTFRVFEADSGYQALELLRTEAIDLAIVDLSMPGMTGLQLVTRIKAECAQMPVLVLSMHSEEQYAMRAFRAGADGYVVKDSASRVLVEALRKLLDGGSYVSEQMAARVVHRLNGHGSTALHEQLSNRELEVLQLIVNGHRMTEIARRLNLSIKTVSTHKTRIQDKLQISTTAALIRYGIEHELITPDGGSPTDETAAPRRA